MSWNGSGTFNRLYSWVADKAAGLNISSTRMDADTNDISANGFGNCLTRDGQGTASANLPMNGFRHTSVGAGQVRDDYARLDQVQDAVALNWTIATGSSDAIAAAYTPAITALVDGQFCFVRAIAENATTTPTFAPNGLPQHTITKFGGSPLTVGDIPGNFYELCLRFNLANLRWELLNPAPSVANGVITPTGAVVDYIGATAPNGYILAIGASIGDALSAATERANADTADLFVLIWNSANVVSGEGQVQDSSGNNVARGISAVADFAAHRRILTPDYSDRTSRGKSGSTVRGEVGGSDTATIDQANLPNVAFTVSGITLNTPTHKHTVPIVQSGLQSPIGAGQTPMLAGGSTDTSLVAQATTVATQGTAASGGAGTALTIKPKYIVQTKIIKL